MVPTVSRHRRRLVACGYHRTPRRIRAIEEAEEPSELLRFEDVEDDDDICSSDDESAGSVASDASISEHLNSGSRRVFKTPVLRPKQQQAIKTILFDKSRGGNTIVVDLTGRPPRRDLLARATWFALI